VGETAIAIALIVGAFTNLTALVGVLLSVVIWSTAEGFGGPYDAGSTDVGTAIIYPLVFVGLFLSSAGLYYGINRRLTPALGRFGYLASGWFVKRSSKVAVVKPLAIQ
jgi:thiosulfate dehydrogenase (quinone) large subunit